ncbi:nucleosome assembly protein family [Myriangium duriaei CBS 260.36]|uniref:Nucleosome assembly protein family n=1 Tax=Myriangium duriaei CBS 260.36 TaxID=1168546 RepID=A0A9P4MHQ7_9PEZI|nr:nucleosome assembly protein family [Myriangium duriaei CBS 260.36]
MSDAMDDAQEMVTYEELANLECEFDDLDVEIIRKQYFLSKPLYAKRKAAVAKIDGFWPLVLEESPQEIDRYIQPSDSEIFASSLKSIEVDRFELTSESDDTVGDPRSVSIKFEFSENEWFSDRVLEKRFWWRRASDGWTGLVSEPVNVSWRKGKDPTKGLMDGAVKLWQARKQNGDMQKRDLPEFDHMAKITQTWNGDNTSFFTWFAFVSSRRWVSQEESSAAVQAEKERRKRASQGLEDGPTQLPEDDQLEKQVEAHEDGDTLATILAEDLWPGAIKYFTQAQEAAVLSDEEFEEDDEDEDEDEDESGNEGELVDLRKLAQGVDSDGIVDASNGGQPPRKKRKA